MQRLPNGKYHLESPLYVAEDVLKRNLVEAFTEMSAKNVNTLELTGPVPVGVYLIVAVRAVKHFRNIRYCDGKRLVTIFGK